MFLYSAIVFSTHVYDQKQYFILGYEKALGTGLMYQWCITV